MSCRGDVPPSWPLLSLAEGDGAPQRDHPIVYPCYHLRPLCYHLLYRLSRTCLSLTILRRSPERLDVARLLPRRMPVLSTCRGGVVSPLCYCGGALSGALAAVCARIFPLCCVSLRPAGLLLCSACPLSFGRPRRRCRFPGCSSLAVWAAAGPSSRARLFPAAAVLGRLGLLVVRSGCPDGLINPQSVVKPPPQERGYHTPEFILQSPQVLSGAGAGAPAAQVKRPPPFIRCPLQRGQGWPRRSHVPEAVGGGFSKALAGAPAPAPCVAIVADRGGTAAAFRPGFVPAAAGGAWERLAAADVCAQAVGQRCAFGAVGEGERTQKRKGG